MVSRFARDERWLDEVGAREAYVGCLGRAVEQCDAEVLAYCLMSNHVHLVVVQGRDPLERLSKSVHTGFANWVSRNRGRGSKSLGPVFAERPRQLLVDEEGYLLELVRYVHNNPVRAGVSRFARSCDWSSHQAYIGRAAAPDWLRMGYVLDRYGKRPAAAASKFDAFVDEGRRDGREPLFSGSVERAALDMARSRLGDGCRVTDGVLGGEEFIERVLADIGKVDEALSKRGSEMRTAWRRGDRPSPQEVLDAVLLATELDAAEYESSMRSRASVYAKRLAIWLWVREFGGKQMEIARVLGIHTSAVARHYAYALRSAAEFDEVGSAVVALLDTPRAKRKRRSAKLLPAAESAPRRRYLVDVEEET